MTTTYLDRTVYIGGLRTRYLEAGPADGEVIVLLHDGAWGASADLAWGDVIPLASERYHVIAPDMLGFGGTEKAIVFAENGYDFRMRHVLQLLDVLGVAQPFHLIGNSFGGSVAIRATIDPAIRSRLASVVSIGGTGGPWKLPKMGEVLGPFDGTEANLRRIMTAVADDFDGLDDHVARRLVNARDAGHYLATMSPHQKLPEGVGADRAPDLFPETLQGVDTPMLLVVPTRDDLVESEWGERIQAHVPQAVIERPPLKHSSQISSPKEIWDVISPFLLEHAR